MAMFDIKDNLDHPSESFYDLFLKNRQAMPPDVAAQMPMLGANTPGQQMFQAQQQQAPDALAQTVQGLGAAVTQASVGPEAKPKDMQAAQQGNAEVLDSINPLKPLPSYGPQGFGRALGMPENAGGILGLGVQPIDILGFALGAALGRGQSPESAMKTAMWGASLPRAFRENQEKNALEFVRAKQAEFNSQIAGGNLAMRQQEYGLNSELKNLQILQKLEGLDAAAKRKLIIAGVQSGQIDLNTATGRALALGSLTAAEINVIKENVSGGRAMTNTELAAYAVGAPRGATIPQEMTPQQAGAALDLLREKRQELTPTAMGQQTQLAGDKAKAVSDNTPLPTPVQTKAVQLQDLKSQLQTIKDNYSPEWVGPVAYRTYNIRRQSGKIDPREVKFHQAQEYLQDIRLRVQSGAATSEPEAARLLGTLPQGTDLPANYASGYNKAKKDIERTLGMVMDFGTTAKKDITGTSIPSRGAPAGVTELPKGATVRKFNAKKGVFE